MQKINGTAITLTRGDTFKAEITMYYDNNGERQIYTPQEGDVIRFALKKRYTDDCALIYKVIPNDTLLLKLDPIDTNTLPFGLYVYDVEITYTSGEVDTFIDRASFKLTEDVA